MELFFSHFAVFDVARLFPKLVCLLYSNNHQLDASFLLEMGCSYIHVCMISKLQYNALLGRHGGGGGGGESEGHLLNLYPSRVSDGVSKSSSY